MTKSRSPEDKIADARQDLAAGHHNKAWQAVSELLHQFPNDPYITLNAAFVGLRSGHAQNAVAILRQLTVQQPDIAEGWNLLGHALLAQGLSDQALPALVHAARLMPNDGRLQWTLGKLQQQAGDRRAAVAAYRRAIALMPNDPQINASIGLSLASLHEDEDAIVALSRAAAAPDASFDVLAQLAGLLLRQSGMAKARPVLDAAIATMMANLTAGRYDEALRNEIHLDQCFIRPIENEEHAEQAFALWRDAMSEAGAKAAVSLPPRPLSSRRDGTVPVVGFFLFAASLLGHVELTLDYLEAMALASEIDPRIYVFSKTDPRLKDEAHRRGLSITFIDDEWTGGKGLLPYQRLLWLRDRLAQDGVAALVWISVPSLVHFGAALGVAPINIFWALRFRPIASAYVQGFVACASCFERQDVVNGRLWDVIPLAFHDLAGPPRVEEAAAIRRELGQPAIVFGSLARSEKMQGDAWLEAVGSTLQSCPQAIFLWTGRSEDPRVARALRDMGVAHQSRFVGWVDTRLYAQVLDIFLDTAPVGCGMTAMQAMAWGKPLVSFKDPLTNWGQCLRPVLEGKIIDPEAKSDIERIFKIGSDDEVLAWAETPNDYAALAKRLAEDAEYRAAVGAAGKTFTDRYFGSPDYAAKRFASVIRSVLERANGS